MSQSYLNKWPLLNLWLCSSSLVRSQTLKRKQFSSCVYWRSCKSVLQICFQNFRASLKTSNKRINRAENGVFIFRNKIWNIWKMTPNVIYLLLMLWSHYLCLWEWMIGFCYLYYNFKNENQFDSKFYLAKDKFYYLSLCHFTQSQLLDYKKRNR